VLFILLDNHMPNVVYHTHKMKEWITIASELQTKYNLKPVYWICNRSFREAITDSFPRCICQDKFSATRGVVPEEYKGPVNYSIDKNLIEELGEEFRIGIKMMDRIDPDHYFTYDHRFRHFAKIVGYWINVLDHLKIDYVVFSQFPHVVSDYAIYVACKYHKISKVMFKEITPIDGLVHSMSDIHTPLVPKKTNKCLKVDDNIYQQILNYMSSLSVDGRKWQQEQVNTGVRKKDDQSKLTAVLDLIIRGIKRPKKIPPFIHWYIFSKGDFPRLPRRGVAIEDAEHPWRWYVWLKINAARRRRHLKQTYDQLSSVPSYDGKYVYFPLHYQPELTTSPLGGIYAHQHLIANLLSCEIPDDWTIYVKEHPVQFSNERKGERGRTTTHYHELANINGVELIDIDADQTRLLQEAELVTTVTGTAGWEAMVMGTPAAIFGNAWYRSCDETFYVSSAEDLESVINTVKNGYEVDQSKIDDFVEALADACFLGYLYPSKDKIDIDSETNGRRLLKEIEEQFELSTENVSSSATEIVDE